MKGDQIDPPPQKKTILKKPSLIRVNKVAGPQPCKFIKKRLQHKCFPVNIAKFVRTPILKNICERLLLNSV